MRLQLTATAICVLGSRVIREDNLENYVPVQVAYGNVTAAGRAAAMHMAKAKRQTYARTHLRRAADKAAYDSVRISDNCIFPLDLLILQDLTGSHAMDFRDTILRTLPAMSATIPVIHPGSRFSLVTYRDKPINELGELDDDCYTVQAVSVDDPLDLKPYLEKEEAGGGWDKPENQYGAMMAVLKSPNSISWHNNPLATPIIIHITDSEPHFEGDGRQHLYPFLGPWGVGYDETLAHDYCNNRYYPSPMVVHEALEEEGVYLGSVIVRPEWMDGRALAAWRWFNEFIGNPDDLLTALDDSLDNWFGLLREILREIEELECDDPSTTDSPTSAPSSGPTQSEIATDPHSTQSEVPTDPALTQSEGSTDQNSYEDNEEHTSICVCPDEGDECCERQPEVLIAILKRPKVLDIHLEGYENDPEV